MQSKQSQNLFDMQEKIISGLKYLTTPVISSSEIFFNDCVVGVSYCNVLNNSYFKYLLYIIYIWYLFKLITVDAILQLLYAPVIAKHTVYFFKC